MLNFVVGIAWKLHTTSRFVIASFGVGVALFFGQEERVYAVSRVASHSLLFVVHKFNGQS